MIKLFPYAVTDTSCRKPGRLMRCFSVLTCALLLLFSNSVVGQEEGQELLPEILGAGSSLVLVDDHTINEDLTICGAASRNSVRITFVGTIQNVWTVRLLLPEGVEFVPGSGAVLSTNITGLGYTVGGTLSAPVFTFSSAVAPVAGRFFVLAWDRETGGDCVAYNNYEGGDASVKDAIEVNITNPAGGQETFLDDDPNRNAYNLLPPSLSINSLALATVLPGDTVTRCNVITNGGVGYLRGYRFEIREDTATLQTLGVTTGGGLPLVLDTSYIDGSERVLVYEIGAAEIMEAGDADVLFEIGEQLELCREYVVLGCGELSSGARAYWGCAAECQSTTVSNQQTNIGQGVPNIGIQYTKVSEGNLCDGDVWQFTYTNTGNEQHLNSGAARDIFVVLGVNYWSIPQNPHHATVNPAYVTDFTINGIPLTSNRVGISGDTIYLSQLLSDPGMGLADLDGDGIFDDLPVGQSFSIRYRLVWQCDRLRTENSSACNRSHDISPQGSIEYRNVCEVNFKQYNTHPFRYVMGPRSTTVSGPTDVLQLTPFRPRFCLTLPGENTWPSASTHRKEFRITLPDGFFLAGDGNATYQRNWGTIAPVGLTIDGNDIVIDTTYFQGSQQICIELDLMYDCALVAGGTGAISYQWTYFSDPDNCPDCYMPLSCGSYTVGIHCPCIPTGGPENLIASVRRMNYGWTDHTLTTPVDPETISPVKRKTMVAGDTLEVTHQAMMMAGASFDNLHLRYRLDKTPTGASFLQYVDQGELRVRKTDGTVYTCTDIPLPSIHSETALDSFLWDFTPLVGACLPSGFLFEPGDSIQFKAYFRYNNANTGNIPLQPANTNIIFFSENPPGVRHLCGWSGTEMYLTSTSIRNSVSSGTGVLNGCTPRGVYLYWDVNYLSGGDLYPNEFRPAFYIDSFWVILPPGIVYDNNETFAIHQMQHTMDNDVYANYPLPAPIVRGDTLVYINDGNWPLSDLSRALKYGGTNVNIPVIASCNAQAGNLRYDLRIFQRDRYYTNPEIETGVIPGTDDFPLMIRQVGMNRDYTNPAGLSVVDLTGLVQATKLEESWEVELRNPTNAQAPYVWMALDTVSTSGIEIVRVVDVLTGTELSPLSYGSGIWYHAMEAGLPGGEVRRYRIDFRYSSCHPDGIDFKAGWDCTGYPDSPEDYICVEDELRLRVEPKLSELQLEVVGEPAYPIQLCEALEYVFRYTSSQSSYVVNPQARIRILNGLNLNGIPTVEYPAGSGNLENAVFEIAGGWMEIDLSAHSEIGEGGIPGTDDALNAAERQVLIRLNFFTGCDFVSDARLTVAGFGDRPCGLIAGNNGLRVHTQNITVEGSRPNYAAGVSVESGTLELDCTTGRIEFSTTLFSRTGDEVTTGANDSLILTLPEGVEYIAGSFDCGTATCPVLERIYTDGLDRTVLVFSIPITTILDPVRFEYSIEVRSDGSADCADELDFSASVGHYISGLPCITEPGGVCNNVRIQLGYGEGIIRIEKGIGEFVDMGVIFNGNYVVSGGLVMTGSDYEPGAELHVDFYCLDDEGNVTGASVHRQTFSGPIGEGDTLLIAADFAAGCNPVNGLYVELGGTDNCVCGTTGLALDIDLCPEIEVVGPEPQCYDTGFALEIIYSIDEAIVTGVWSSTGGGTFSDPTGRTTVYESVESDALLGLVTIYYEIDDPTLLCYRIDSVTIEVIADDAAWIGALPGDEVVECDDVPEPEELEAEGNCGEITVTFEEEETEGECANEYTITRTWTARNSNGTLLLTHVQVLTVEDTTAPDFVEDLPADITVECDAIPDPVVLTATDNCGDANVAYAQTIDDGDCGGASVITRTWTARDACGNETIHVQYITVEDTTAPDISACEPRDETIECAFEDNEANAYQWHLDNIGYLLSCATDNCSEDLTVTHDYDWANYEETCGNAGTLTVTYQVVDDCGNISEEYVATLTIEDTTAPDITACEPRDETIECAFEDNEANAYQWHLDIIEYLQGCATDECNDGFEFTVTHDYDWANYEETCGNAGTLTVTYQVVDDCGNVSADFVATLTIEDTTAPDISACVDQDMTLECNAEDNENAAYQWHLDIIEYLQGCATDECNDGFEFTITHDYDWANYEEGCGNTGELTVTYQVVDDCGNVSADFVATLTVEDTTPLNIEGCVSQDATIECAFEDNEANAYQWHLDIIEYLQNCAADACNEGHSITVTHDYDWANYDESCGNTGELTVTYQVVDDCGNVSEDFVATLTIEDTTAPDISGCATQDMTIECAFEDNEANAYQWHLDIIEYLQGCATDECNDGFEFTITHNYDWANYEEGCGNTGTLTVTYQVVDDCGNISDDFVATLTIEDTTAPDISECADQDMTIECAFEDNEANAYQWHLDIIAYLEGCATDECNDGFGFTITHDYDWANYEEGCGNTGTLTVTYQVVDDCGNVSEDFVATLTIEDTTAPDISGCANQNLTLECNAEDNENAAYQWHLDIIEYLQGCATDECNDGYEFTITHDYDWANYEEGCGNTGTLTVTYQVVDDCGNISEDFVATLTIEDTTAPDISECADQDMTIECAFEDNEANAYQWHLDIIGYLQGCATDECNDGYEFTITHDYDWSNYDEACGNTGTLTVTYQVVDDCGNVSEDFVATLTIEDTTAPDISGCAAQDLTVECNAEENENMAYQWHLGVIAYLEGCATDECNDGYGFTITHDYDWSNYNVVCGTAGTLTVTYQVVDDCGNISENFVATITIEDTTAPEIVITHPVFEGVVDGGLIEVECYSADPEWVYPVLCADDIEVYDDCSAVVFTIEETFVNNGDCKADGFLAQHFYVVTATDDCDNVTTLEFELRVVDRTPPVIVGVPADTTVTCNNIPVPGMGGCHSGGPAEIYVVDECECASLEFEEIVSNKSCDYNYDILRRWTATDNCGNVTVAEQRIYVRDQSGPEFIFHEPVLETIPNGSTYYHECVNGEFPEWSRYLNGNIITAVDGCSGSAEVTFSKQQDRTERYCEDGVIEQWVYEWRATDNCGNESIYGFTIGVVDRTGPQFIGEALVCSDDEAGYPVAIDMCSEVTYMGYDDRKIKDDCGRPVIERTWIAYDLCGNASQFVQHILLEQPDVEFFVREGLLSGGFESGDTIAVNCGEEYLMDRFREPGVVSGSTDCTGSLKLIFSHKVIENRECEDGYSRIHRYSWSGVDECGKVREFVANFGIKDTKPPYFHNNASNVVLDCNDELPAINVADGCSEVTLVLVQQDTIFKSDVCDRNVAFIQVYEAVDACGNSAGFERYVSIVDESAPVFIASQYTGCIWEDETPLVADECDGIIEKLEYVDSPILVDDCGLYEYIERRWVAGDDCGNVSEMTQKLLVSYDFDKVEIRNPFIGVLERGQVYEVECDDYIGDIYNLFKAGDIVNHADCELLKTDVRVTLEAGYDCRTNGGRMSRYRVSYRLQLPCETVYEYVVYVDVRDTKAPVFTYAPQDRYLGCNDPALFEMPVIEEGCSQYTLNYDERVEESGQGEITVIRVYRTWTATDLCGNTSTHTQVITIREYDHNAEIVLLNTPYCNSSDNKATVELDHHANGLKFEWKVISGDCIITSGQHTQTITYFIGFSPVRLRVTITDEDGCVIVKEISFICEEYKGCETCPRSTITDYRGDEELLLYPNPTRYSVYIEWEAKRNEVVKVRVVTVDGVMTKDVVFNQKKGYNKLEIDARNFSSGVYIIELEEEYQTRHGRFVKIE